MDLASLDMDLPQDPNSMTAEERLRISNTSSPRCVPSCWLTAAISNWSPLKATA